MLRPMGEERVFERIFKHLAADADNEYMMIDATIEPISTALMREKNGAQAIGKPRGGLSTKISPVALSCPELTQPLVRSGRKLTLQA
jgi:hypothetical protein